MSERSKYLYFSATVARLSSSKSPGIKHDDRGKSAATQERLLPDLVCLLGMKQLETHRPTAIVGHLKYGWAFMPFLPLTFLARQLKFLQKQGK